MCSCCHASSLNNFFALVTLRALSCASSCVNPEARWFFGPEGPWQSCDELCVDNGGTCSVDGNNQLSTKEQLRYVVETFYSPGYCGEYVTGGWGDRTPLMDASDSTCYITNPGGSSCSSFGSLASRLCCCPCPGDTYEFACPVSTTTTTTTTSTTTTTTATNEMTSTDDGATSTTNGTLIEKSDKPDEESFNFIWLIAIVSGCLLLLVCAIVVGCCSRKQVRDKIFGCSIHRSSKPQVAYERQKGEEKQKEMCEGHLDVMTEEESTTNAKMAQGNAEGTSELAYDGHSPATDNDKVVLIDCTSYGIACQAESTPTTIFEESNQPSMARKKTKKKKDQAYNATTMSKPTKRIQNTPRSPREP